MKGIFSKNLNKIKKLSNISNQKRNYRYLTKEIIQKMPKADLHFHLDGSMRVGSILEMAEQQKIKLPSHDHDELKNLLVVRDDCPDLIQFLKAFDITLSVLQTPEALQRTMFEVCEDSFNDGVKYLEVRFSPILHVQKGMQIDDVLEAVCDIIPKIESTLPITVRIIVCAMRHMSSEVSKELALASVRFKDRGVVAFDLAGPEKGFPPQGKNKFFSFCKFTKSFGF